jgi:hypothetical protein
MKRTLLVLLLVACSKNEQSTPSAGSPIAPAPVAKTSSRSEAALPESQAHPGVWSIPPRGVVPWLVGDDAKPQFGGALQTWTNEYLPTAKATAERPEMQPNVVANVINQHSVVRFDGNNNIMESNVDISPQRMPDVTVFAVVSSRTDAPSPLRKVYGDDDGGYDRVAGLDNRGGDKNYCVFTGKGVTGDFVLKMNTVYVTEEQFTKTDVSAWVNGKQTLDKTPAEWSTALPHMFIGGTGTAYHEPWFGDIAEIIVYSRVLSDLERMQIEDYLGKKYGVQMPR